MNDPAVAIRDLIFNYGRLRVIDNISLEIPRGISFGLLGSNGSGKTTLIRLMVGLLKPAAGSIQRLGGSFDSQRDKDRLHASASLALYRVDGAAKY